MYERLKINGLENDIILLLADSSSNLLHCSTNQQSLIIWGRYLPKDANIDDVYDSDPENEEDKKARK